MAIELLRRLEAKTGRSVHEMFDFICGVSTGAIVAVLVGECRGWWVSGRNRTGGYAVVLVGEWPWLHWWVCGRTGG